MIRYPASPSVDEASAFATMKLSVARCVGWVSLALAILAPFLQTAVARISKIFPCPESCDCDIVTQRVDCSDNGLSRLPSSLPVSTRILLFRGNNLEDNLTLKCFNITSLTRLRQLSLANNSLIAVHDDVLSHQERIIKLDMSFNHLQSIPETIRTMRFLKHLYLSSNHISYITNADFSQKNCMIEQLHLSRNEISIIQEGAFNSLGQLKKLYLGSNLISNISSGLFDRLSLLQQLDLSHNRLGADLDLQSELRGDDIPTPKTVELVPGPELMYGLPVNCSDWFHSHGAPALTHLNLAGNIIKIIADNAFIHFPLVTSLNLSENEIVTLPVTLFHNMSYLVELDMSGNNLTTLHGQQFRGNPSLQFLNLNRNQLQELPDDLFNWSEDMSYLDMSHNNLRDVNFLGVKMRSLVNLHMSYNALEVVSSIGFTSLVSIEFLNLQNSMLGEIPNVRNLTKLREIDLSSNAITSIPYDAFDGDIALETILLQGNGILTIREEVFSGLPALTTLNAEDNPVHCDCNVKWLAAEYDYSSSAGADGGDYAMFSDIPSDVSADYSAPVDWRDALRASVVCVKPPIAEGMYIKEAINYYSADLICNHFANPHSIMILILTWFLIIMVFLILFWSRTFWMARKQLGFMRPHKSKGKLTEETCYVISSKKAGNGQYQLIPDKNETDPLMFLHNHKDESCKMRTFDRSSELFIETTV
ncbi:uncharacterized protein [Diadema antillarum]|uniref:uncharacterized protein n=1 Tax=Diadema antillarum TaxID=105358 RepID=UPI003A8703D9